MEAAPRMDALQRNRLVVLGASNVRRSLSTIVDLAPAYVPTPLDLLLAPGHGRSYGKESWIPGRRLPGLLQCGVWETLAAQPAKSTQAILTDIGNDLLYGTSPDRLVKWVLDAVDRLNVAVANDVENEVANEIGEKKSGIAEKILVTELPTGNLAQLSERRFKFFCRFLFPACPFSLQQISDHAYAVNDQLRAHATTHGYRTTPLLPAWYGFDPIHLTRRAERTAWHTLLSKCLATSEVTTRGKSWMTRRQRVSLSLAMPAERKLLGWNQQAEQPVRRYQQDVSVSLY